MLKRKLTRHLKWINLKEEIACNNSTVKWFLFGIKIYESQKEITHEISDSENTDIGFTKTDQK